MFTLKAEAEWLGLDRVPTRLHMEETSEKQKGNILIFYQNRANTQTSLFSLAFKYLSVS